MKSILTLSAIFTFLVLPVTAFSTPLNYPPDGVFTSTTVPTTSNPGYLDSYMDKMFGTIITRITDKDVFNAFGNSCGYSNYHPVHQYPKNQSFNSDETYIRINHTLIDAHTFHIVKDITGHVWERKWSNLDPNIIYGMQKHSDRFSFVKQDISAGYNVVDLISFPLSIYDEMYIGPWEGNIDKNDRYVVLSARKKNQSYLTAIVYDIQANSIFAQKDFPSILWRDSSGNQVLDWISVSPLGDYILINYKADPENSDSDFRSSIYEYDMSLNFLRELANQGNHGDMAIDADGREVYVQFEYGSSRGIWSYRLDDGHRLRLLPDKYSGGHISGRAFGRPGWCYVGTNATDHSEIFALKLDGSGTVNHFGHTHKSYSVAAYASPNHDGTKVLFKSDFSTGGEQDSYIARMGATDAIIADCPELAQPKRVDFADYAVIAEHWLEEPATIGDLNDDGVVDGDDLDILSAYWLCECD